MEFEMKRVISKCYILKHNNRQNEIIKVCGNKRLAEHYKKMYEEKDEFADIIIDEEPIIHWEDETMEAIL